MMNVIQKIDQLLKQRGLTYYKLAKLSGLPPSTLSNMRARGTIPSLYTLEQICHGLQISLSQFFIGDSEDVLGYTETQKELMRWLILLTPEQQQLILQLVKSMAGNGMDKV